MKEAIGDRLVNIFFFRWVSYYNLFLLNLLWMDMIRFHAILVDNGVMRLNECETVKKMLSDHLEINLKVVDASDKFLDRLKGITDPEKKRKIIGNTFIEVFESEALKIDQETIKSDHGKIEYLLQGTLYPDVIESISFRGPSATIKTHHVYYNKFFFFFFFF